MKNDDMNKLKNNVEKEMEADIENLELEDVSLEMKVENVNLKPSNNEKIVNDNDSVMEDISDDRNDINQDLNNVDTNNSNDDSENQNDESDLDEELEELDDSVDDNLDEFDQYENEKNSNRNSEDKTKDNFEQNQREKNESNNTDNSNTEKDNKNSDLDNNKSNSNSNQKNENNNLNDKNNNNPNKSNNETLNKNESPNQPKSNPSQSASKDAAKDIKDKKNSFRDRMKRKDPTNQTKPKVKNKNNQMSNSASNGAKKAGQNIANGAKKNGQAAADGAKKAGQAAAKGAQAAGKAAAKAGQGLMNLIINTMPYSLYVIGAILIIFLIMAIVMMVVPGLAGDVNDQGNYAKFSEVDQETLEDMRDLFSKYPNADGALAISTVLYPYYDFLHSGTVENYLITDEDIEESEEELTEEDIEENVDSEEEKSDKVKTEDDRYLYPFRKKKMLNKLEEVLKELNKEDEDAFKTYLKETYFKNDRGYVIDYDEEIMNGYKGYKEMLNNIDSSDEEKFMDLLIKEIYDNKSYFLSYVFQVYSCKANLQSAGTVEVEDMLKSNILVDVKVPSCTSGSNVWDCQSVYTSPISLKQYVFGGTYEEFNSMDIEKTAAQMLAIKSYVIQRGKSMGWGVKTDENGNYVVTIRNNTNDLVYCDTDLGCKSGATEVGSGNRKRDPISSEQKQVFEEAWTKIEDKYIFDKESNKTVGSFCLNRIKTKDADCSWCIKGTCLSHDELANYTNTTYDTIIADQYSKYSMIQVEGDFANVTIAGGVDCTGTGDIDIDDSKFVYYAQTDYKTTAFCGRTLSAPADDWPTCSHNSSICSSGCGLVSMSMVTATLTQNYSINPATLNKEVRVGIDCGPGIMGTVGGSMFPYVAKKYGLTATNISLASTPISGIKQQLDDGGLIIASVCGGLKWNKRYTNPLGVCGGHFLVIRGYEGDSVIISDPYQNSRLKNYDQCLLKMGENCVKHKLDFNIFYDDLKAKGGSLWVFKGDTAFQDLK